MYYINNGKYIQKKAGEVRHIMYGMVTHTYSKSMDQPGKVASPARGQLDREK